jgi:hypothetical protein
VKKGLKNVNLEKIVIATHLAYMAWGTADEDDRIPDSGSDSGTSDCCCSSKCPHWVPMLAAHGHARTPGHSFDLRLLNAAAGFHGVAAAAAGSKRFRLLGRARGT